MIIHKGERFIPAKFRDEAELEHVVYANLADLFGDEAISVPFKTKLLTDDDVQTIPDAIVLDFKNNKWYIVEVELAAHSTYGHILPQVAKLKVAVSTPGGRTRLIDAVFAKIEGSQYKRQQLREQGIEEIEIKHRLERLIKSNKPVFIVPIDHVTKDLTTWKDDQKYRVEFWRISKYLPIDYEIRPLYFFPVKGNPSFAFTAESKAKRSKAVTERNGPLFDLVSAEAIIPQEALDLPRKEKRGETQGDFGEVTADGWIEVEGYKLSPTLAAMYWDAKGGAVGKVVDGWTSWVNGDGKTLQTLRNELPRKKGKVRRAKSPSPSK